MMLHRTLVGLPNTCAGCGAQLDGEAWAENDEQATAGQVFCNDCELARRRAALRLTPADFSVIPGLNAEIAAALQDAGIITWLDLSLASDEALLAISGIGPGRLERIQQWLERRYEE